MDIPEAIFHRAKIVAAERRITFKQLLAEILEAGLDKEPRQKKRLTEPPVRLDPEVSIAPVSKNLMAELDLKADLEKASFK